jgi:soluble lytic murein transglycosylase-like protein
VPVLLALVLLLALAGGVDLVILRPKRTLRAALEAAAERQGIPPTWLVALGETESGLDAGAVNLTGGDLARGGSWGPTQISARTARAFGYTGPMQALSDPELAADLTARMVAEGFAEKSTRPADPESPPFTIERYGTPASFEDLLAVWNAGKPYAQLPAGGSTRQTYIPRALAALAAIEGEGVA